MSDSSVWIKPATEYNRVKIATILRGGKEYPIYQDFWTEVQAGNVPGWSIVHKFGRNPAVPNGSWAFIGQLGAVGHLSAPTAIRIKTGGNVADDAGGAGLRTIVAQGIDTTLAEVTETLTSNGASASAATTTEFWRVHRLKDPQVGTYRGANTGDVVVENAAGGTDIIMLGAGEGQSQYAGFTIPEGKTGYLASALITVNASKPANIRMFQCEDITDTTAPMPGKELKLNFDGVDGFLPFKPNTPLGAIDALTDIWWEGYGGGAITSVSVDFELLLLDDDV